jgi:ABC-type polysaccharide/polyol phosphate export permease
MNRLIKTFYFWLGIFTCCNLASLTVDLMGGSAQDSAWLLYPAAWILQLPLVVAIAVVHTVINQALHRLPPPRDLRGNWLTCSIILFAVSGIYMASQVMRMELDIFLSWDTLKVAVDDTRQILPDIGQRIGLELAILAVLSAGIGFLYTRRYHRPCVEYSVKK